MARTGDAGSSLTTMDEIIWSNEEHRRRTAARLVQRTYNLEDDQTRRILHRRVPERRESFRMHCFTLLEALRDRCGLIYGAIFEYVPPAGGHGSHPSAASPPPRYIVAFRGTMMKDVLTGLHDLYLDGNVVLNTQHDRHRFSSARERIRKLLLSLDDNIADAASCVWLAGHSLGASMALDVGRDLAARDGCYLPTFLFNPPQVSLAPGISMLPGAVLKKVAKGVLCPASYALKAMLGKTVLTSLETDAEELFLRLAPWKPEIYVHERDLICKGFIDYLEQRERVQERFPCLARSAGTLAYRDMMAHLCADVLGLGDEMKEHHQPHLLPSARLWINSREDGNAHELRQWCQRQPELTLSSKLYGWPAA